MSFAEKWMELEIIMVNEISRSEKNKKTKISCSLSYVECRLKRTKGKE
jgi:hypothetical protein